MRSKINLMSLSEELSNDIVDDTEGSVLLQQENSHQLDTLMSQVAQAQDCRDALDSMQQCTTVEEAVAVATEHFKTLLGITDTVGLESLTTERVDNSIAIAQESVFSGIGDAISTNLSSEEKVAEQITKSAQALESKGSRDNDLKSPAWSFVFNQANKSEMSAQEVLSVAAKYKSIVDGSDMKNLISKAASILENISKETDRNWFVANPGSASEIKKLSDQSSKIKQAMKLVLKQKPVNKLGVLSPEQAAKLSSMVLNTSMQNDLESMSKVLKQEIKSGGGMYSIVSSFRYKKEKPADVKIAKAMIEDFKSTLQYIKDFLLYKSKINYSVLQYIKASTK